MATTCAGDAVDGAVDAAGPALADELEEPVTVDDRPHAWHRRR